MKKISPWEMFTRGTIHLHRFAMALRAIEQNKAKRFLEFPIGDVLYINVGPKVWFAWNKKEIHNYGAALIRKIQNPEKFTKHCQFLEEQCKFANLKADEIKNKDLRPLTNSQLADLYTRFYEDTGKVQIILGADIDAIDLVLENFIRQNLTAELRKKFSADEVKNIYKKISVPLHTTYITSQHRDILKAALDKNINSAVKKLERKYWWTPLGWENTIPHTLNYYVSQIQKEKQISKIKEKLGAISQDERFIKTQRHEIIKKYKLSGHFQYLLTVMDKYTRLHDLRKEMQVRNVYAFHLLMKEVSRRLKIKPELLEWVWYEEVNDLLSGKKLNKAENTKRLEAYAVIIQKHKMVTASGTKAKGILQKILSQIPKQTSEIKGLGVTQGVIRGKVKVCSGYQEALTKVKTGDILVTGMTLPDYVPAMRKAAAIVTDEGGITCHAAIVSRELKKVCIVGTKVASQILKDGDMVEVDANKGTVKKL